MTLPLQPIYFDDHGAARFRENKVVRYLLDHGGLNLNDLAVSVLDCPEDWEQFAQLIGYSVSGFGELSYVSDEAYETAEKVSEGRNETNARLAYLEERLEATRSALRELVPKLFKIHPDDLVS